MKSDEKIKSVVGLEWNSCLNTFLNFGWQQYVK